MWVNSSLLNRGFCTAVRISAAAQKKNTIREWHDTNPFQMPTTSVSSAISFPFPAWKCSTAAKNPSECTFGSEHFFGLSTLSLDKLNLAWYMVPNYCISQALSTSTPPSLSGVRLVMLVCRGLRVQAGEVTSNCYLTCRRMAANLRINLRFILPSLCVHVCVRMSKNLLQPVPASENREVYVTIRVRYMPLWLLLLTVSSWEHAGPPPADLEACQARLWCRSVSGGQARSSPRKENDTSKQEPPVLFPVESSSSLAAVTPSRLNAKWTGRRTGCRL